MESETREYQGGPRFHEAVQALRRVVADRAMAMRGTSLPPMSLMLLDDAILAAAYAVATLQEPQP